MNKITNDLFSIDDLPNQEREKDFYLLLTHKDLPRLVGFFITDLIRKSKMPNQGDSLSKIVAMQDFQDFIRILSDNSKEEAPSEKTDEDKLAEL